MMVMATIIPKWKNYFTTRWPDRCHNCSLRIEEGERAFYIRDRDHIYGEVCCGTLPIEELIQPVVVSSAVVDDDEEPISSVPLDVVLPRGRGRRDMCKKCFQIPASNGACGCDY